MFHLIIYIIYGSLYCIAMFFVFAYYVLKFFIMIIITLLKTIFNRKEKFNYTKIKEDFYYPEIKTNFNISNVVPNREENIERKKEFKLVEPTDLEYKMEILKIEDIYKKLGFIVKVTNIKKNKYNTEYEVIFNREIDPYDIFAISDSIISEYSIDGVNIRRMKKEKNKLILSIPLEYKEISK